MSKWDEIIAGLILIAIGIILISVGTFILDTIPESDNIEEGVEEQTEYLPREVGWTLIIMGIISIIISLVVIIASAI
ncbi:MAG: hypothetical protein BV457_01950 [Thermoplasmata archaeon M9B1D]|nr:MAG: hypothetical protein BV457_01950 [Thermoplasmata archaeon M9B1D]